MAKLDRVLKSRDITLPTKVCIVKAIIFSSSYIQMWELDHKESWTLKNWCFWTVVLEKTLENPLDCKEIKPVNPKGNQSRFLEIFIGRSGAEAEVPIYCPPDVKRWLSGKDPGAGKDWGQEEKWATEIRWLNGIIESVDESLSKLWEIVKDRKAWCAAVHRVTKSRTRLSDWTTATWSSNPTPRHISWENYTSKRYMHPCVQSSTIYNSQDLETT